MLGQSSPESPARLPRSEAGAVGCSMEGLHGVLSAAERRGNIFPHGHICHWKAARSWLALKTHLQT